MKTFSVFGEQVEILVEGDATGGHATVVTQVSPPGGGPPPHSHQHEDETFFVLTGDYEFFANGAWQKATPGQPFFGPRGHVHTFRNCGSTEGKMLITVTPAGIDRYLEEISPLSNAPADMAQILAVSARYGISFAHGEPGPVT